MSSNRDFTTPEKKRKPSSPAPPAAPLKKRIKKSPTTLYGDSLLLVYINEESEIVTYTSNHTVLSGIEGHHANIEFLSEELFESVLGVVGGNGYSSVDRELYFEDEILELKKKALIKLFSQEVYGGGKAQAGDIFRGTIVV